MKKILLAILPYWDPMIPPMGITSLKRYLQGFGHKVKTYDFIVKREFLEFYSDYFDILREHIPLEYRGNFNNFGHDVLQNQMMAHQRATDINEYSKLVKLIIYNHYYFEVKEKCIRDLIELANKYYSLLEKYFLELLNKEKPDVVGCSIFKCTLPSTLFVLKLTKKHFPKIKTIVGGGTFNESHAPDSPNFDLLLKETENYIDKFVLGQGEILFQKYLNNELPEQQRVYTKDDINGDILDFTQQDIPDFSDLQIGNYPCMAATASASCIYDCSFCVSKKVNGNYRKKKTEQVVVEMKKMYELHGHQLFFMTDSLINPAIDDLAKEFIKSDITLYYDSYFKVDTPSADIQNTLLWRRGGLYRARLGTESGSQKVLDAMNKQITPDQIKDTVRALAYAGIKPTTYWVIGHPGETEEDFQMTLDIIEELKNDIFQAECNYFLYHYSKQGKADEWAKNRMPLYPEKYDDMLLFKYYTLNQYPLREETFSRVRRFEAHCRKLGIPNPYTINEHIEADERWQKLHKNAVPTMIEFKNFEKYIDECKSIKNVAIANSSIDYMSEFSFKM